MKEGSKLDEISLKKANMLLENGNKFTFENFSIKSQYGYTGSICSEYISWKGTVEKFLVDTFGNKSIIYKNF